MYWNITTVKCLHLHEGGFTSISEVVSFLTLVMKTCLHAYETRYTYIDQNILCNNSIFAVHKQSDTASGSPISTDPKPHTGWHTSKSTTINEKSGNMSNYKRVLFLSTIHHSYIAFLSLTEQNIFLKGNPFLWRVFYI